VSRNITDKQHAFIMRLMAERTDALGITDVQEARRAMDLDNLTSKDAGVLITRLLEQFPKNADPDMPEVVAKAARSGRGNRSGFCFACRAVVDDGAGFYFLDGGGKWAVHHKVGECIERAPGEPVAPAGIDLSHVPAGSYAVPGDPDRLKVLIEKPTVGNWAGWTFVKDAAVYGWGGRLGKIEPGGTYVGKSMDKVAAIAADPVSAMAEYGHITGTCGKCRRPLEDPESVARGIGPVCYQKMGM
jgi:hypothetical protein